MKVFLYLEIHEKCSHRVQPLGSFSLCNFHRKLTKPKTQNSIDTKKPFISENFQTIRLRKKFLTQEACGIIFHLKFLFVKIGLKLTKS